MKNYVPVNKQALYTLLNGKGKRISEVSEELGLHKDYLSNTISAKKGLEEVYISYFCNTYGFNRKDFVVEDVKEEPKEADLTIDYGRLEEIIYHAVLRAWSTPNKEE